MSASCLDSVRFHHLSLSPIPCDDHFGSRFLVYSTLTLFTQVSWHNTLHIVEDDQMLKWIISSITEKKNSISDWCTNINSSIKCGQYSNSPSYWPWGFHAAKPFISSKHKRNYLIILILSWRKITLKFENKDSTLHSVPF